MTEVKDKYFQAPDRKVWAGNAASGVIAIAMAWTLKEAFGIDMPADVAVSYAIILTVAVNFVVQYLIPNKK